MGQLQPLREDMAGMAQIQSMFLLLGFSPTSLLLVLEWKCLLSALNLGAMCTLFLFLQELTAKKLALSLRRNFRLVRIFKT